MGKRVKRKKAPGFKQFQGECTCRNHIKAPEWLPQTHANEGWSSLSMAVFGEGRWQRAGLLASDAQLTGLTEDDLEDRHERRRLAEVAGADDVRVGAQPFRVVPRLNAPGNAVQTIDDGWGKLKQRGLHEGTAL